MRRFVLLLVVGCMACSGGGRAADDVAADVADAADGTDGVLPEIVETIDVAPDVPLVAPVPADCQPNTAPFPERPTPAVAPTLPLLHVQGTDVVDEAGNKVALRGINLGGWLMIESWMAGLGTLSQDQLFAAMQDQATTRGLDALYKDAQQINYFQCQFLLKAQWVCVQEWRAYMETNASADQTGAVSAFWAWFDEQPWVFEERTFWRWFEKRFGYAGMLELRKTWRDNYITELDLERVAALGMNLVRVPVWYQVLETDQEGENGFVPEGWQRLDQLMTWARRHGVYVMLDLHGAPGGQSPWWHQGLENGGFFFQTPACVDKAARLWGAIAHYFKDEPHLAGYDLLNEPAGAKTKKEFCDAHQKLYEAVRAEDADHIVLIEDGYMAPDKICGPGELGWTNAMMQFHDYPGGDTAEQIEQSVETKELDTVRLLESRMGCPLLYGEFNVYQPVNFEATDDPANRWQLDAMDRVLSVFNRRGIHWTPWSWKHYTTPSLWGVYHPTVPGQRVDLKNATLPELKAAFAGMNSTSFVIDQAYEAILKARAADPVAPLNLAPPE